MEKWALITGATAGIGKAVAEQMAKNQWNLFLTGRRDQRLKEISQKIQENFAVECRPLCFDISQQTECEEIFAKEKDLSRISVLINNAGLAKGVEPIQEAKLDDWNVMIDTNLRGLLTVTRLSLPFLIKNQPSHIVNIGSVAGRWVYPGGGVYCATKFAVGAFSEGLRMDLVGHDIRVTNICPGKVETEFSEVRLQDKEKAKRVYANMLPLRAEDIADCVLWSLSRPKHVNIQEMVVFPTDQAGITQIRHRPEAGR